MSFDIREKIQKQIQTALKERNNQRVSVLRLLLSSIKNKEIQSKKALTDDELISVVSSQIKQRKESIEGYTKGGRTDLANQEESEINILQEFLPPQIDDAELMGLIDSAIKETNAESPKDMGKLMARLMPDVKGRADGKHVNQLVKQRLSQQ
ncbi:MAG: GatB/YqeY domain-containing protein [bacterium]